MGLEGFPKDGLLLFGGGSGIGDGRSSSLNHWACGATDRDEIFPKDLDVVGGKQSHHAPVPAQATHPPFSIARIQAFDEIPFDNSQIALCLSSP